MQCFDHTYRPETTVSSQKINGGKSHFYKEGIDDPVMTQYLLESQCSNKGRKDHGEHDRDPAKIFAGKIVPVKKESQGESYEKDKESSCYCNAERIEQPLKIESITENFLKERYSASLFHNRINRKKKEHGKKEKQGGYKNIFQYFSKHFIFLPLQDGRLFYTVLLQNRSIFL